MISLYVHNDLLEWFENYLIENLSPENNLIVEEICHHGLDDNITHIVSDRSGDDIDLLMDCLTQSKYQMFWLSESTFFTVINKNAEHVVNNIEMQLKNADVMQYLCNRYEKDVGWLNIKEILVYEFEPHLEQIHFQTIDEIFWDNILPGNKSPSLFLAEVLPWHQAQYNYIDIDTLALDICGEEWIRYNLLRDLNLDDLLSIELANKDYRHHYYDHYLDNYLQKCIAKKLPFNVEDDNKIEFPLPYFDDKEKTGYFMYKFRKYISTLYTSDSNTKIDFDYIAKILNIRNFHFLEDRAIDLNKIDSDDIIKLCKPVHTAVYEISSTFNFTNSLFVQLLSLPNVKQIYSFNFMEQITFEVPLIADKLIWLGAAVDINMFDSGAQNSQKLGDLIEYFFQLFQNVAENVHYIFYMCTLTDYRIFRNIGNSSITFESMAISHEELLQIASYLCHKNVLVLRDCIELHDLNILEFIKQSKIIPSYLSITGETSCTFLVNFLIAEYLIKRKGGTNFSIPMTELPFIEEFQHIFVQKRLEFFTNDDMMLIRNFKTKEIVNAYNLLNEIADDDDPPFDYD